MWPRLAEGPASLGGPFGQRQVVSSQDMGLLFELFAAEDTCRLVPGTVRLLKELADEHHEESGTTFQRLAAELQHVLLSANASMLQAARGRPATS